MVDVHWKSQQCNGTNLQVFVVEPKHIRILPARIPRRDMVPMRGILLPGAWLTTAQEEFFQECVHAYAVFLKEPAVEEIVEGRSRSLGALAVQQ